MTGTSKPISVAVNVSTDVTIDWEELGRVFADQTSPDQAAFIIGFYESVMDAQLAYIGSEKALNLNRADIARVIQMLAEFIESPA